MPSNGQALVEILSTDRLGPDLAEYVVESRGGPEYKMELCDFRSGALQKRVYREHEDGDDSRMVWVELRSERREFDNPSVLDAIAVLTEFAADVMSGELDSIELEPNEIEWARR